ncbi:MAG TPA: (S)-ureidoglycine aminohydrolase [Thermodesulfobacteriota bacterium]|nr:(S)-ureidoglycine aminohydrolase [Thermodesulfobacteriota bacterium]
MTQRFIPTDADIVSCCRAITKPGSYMILPRANRVENILPEFEKTFAQVLVTPRLGARFIQHELLVEPGGATRQPIQDGLEHFLYVLEGGIHLHSSEGRYELTTGGFAFLPERISFEIKNLSDQKSRVFWTKRRFIPFESLKPEPIISNEKDIPAFPCDTYMEQHLIPYDINAAYDLAFNLLNFDPGVYFGFVESHIMEHGLYMLEGRGIYWLNGNYHEVQKDDFIYMAPYCPQFFYATGWVKGRYLIYKDVNRDFVDDLK